MRSETGVLCGIGLALCAQTAAGSDESRETYIGVFGDQLVEPDKKHVPLLDQGRGFDLRYGVKTGSPWFYEFRAFHTTLEPVDKTLTEGARSGVGADLVFPLHIFGFTPFALAGVGYGLTDSIDRTQYHPFANVGLGIGTPSLRIYRLGLRLRVEGRYSGEIYQSSYADLHALAGLEVAWMEPTPLPPPAAAEEPLRVVEPVEVPPEPAALPPSPPPPPPPPEPPVVLAPVAWPQTIAAAPAGPADSDRDEVNDDADRCPDSPRGKPVDKDGCTILEVLTLKGVTFEVNSDRLRPDSAAVLDEAVAQLNTRFPQARIEVAGHTDSSGKDDYNRKLSQRRAETVRRYLIESGVAAARLSATGYGEAEPVTENDTSEGRSRNRRVELRVKAD